MPRREDFGGLRSRRRELGRRRHGAGPGAPIEAPGSGAQPGRRAGAGRDRPETETDLGSRPASRPFIVPSRFLSILSRAAPQADGAPRRHSCVPRVS
ncbi:hypothetical protein BO443_10284 [Burkholderia orbicola]